ncbi:MAG: ACT domain-containing protein [Candidatus Freyarchaeota archaeon]|nr:ACT domain-containing protein [Candidatus Jordarchaeia archaeon]MBS7270551.1 ACT domain-containing protein [Candidatus Jordarchaeia archaeon]MBS7280432.1 ACT domain-containing protein [Candidatus Jordarchaeia archaeon]
MPREVKQEPISIAEAARLIVGSRPSIVDGLRQGVINFSALAEMIKEQVMEIVGRQSVNVDSIKMALMRYAEELKSKKKLLEEQITEVIAKSILELKNDVAVLTVDQKNFIIRFDQIFKSLNSFRFLQLTQGNETFTVVTDLQSKEKIVEVVGQKSIILEIEDQSVIVIISPHQIIEVPGVIAYITDLLSTNGVNITQIISCYTDTLLIVDRKDALRAYQILENKILSLRKMLK